ncbi:hypothetical protein KOI35_14230 [Actinoplanes bogorensis]|uniref:DUF4192 family protein n=1 Tax=Paractinoplanes bogorensis TaxID=1610840 RepID=A0ABS5YMI3_9ACTN|nr:hypothetical protein [Actinoplanes bogorensis]MBU2664657.1 hypothetical protein [Actinoplanes bogorensis]
MLDEVLRPAVRVRVTDRGPSGPLVLEVTDAAAIGRLRAALTTTGSTGAYCACHGDLGFDFLDADDRSLAVVGFHHAVTLRWSGWEDGDARLRDGRAVLHWLADQGLPEPLAQEERRRHERSEAQRVEQSWIAAAPPVVRDLAEVAANASHTNGVIPPDLYDRLRERLTAAFPGPLERTGVLLAWYGAGTGRLSGYPVHEAAPAPLLAETPIARIVETLLTHPDDDAIAAGAIRHLRHWKSRPHLKRDLATIPEALRARLNLS